MSIFSTATNLWCFQWPGPNFEHCFSTQRLLIGLKECKKLGMQSPFCLFKILQQSACIYVKSNWKWEWTKSPMQPSSILKLIQHFKGLNPATKVVGGRRTNTRKIVRAKNNTTSPPDIFVGFFHAGFEKKCYTHALIKREVENILSKKRFNLPIKKKEEAF